MLLYWGSCHNYFWRELQRCTQSFFWKEWIQNFSPCVCVVRCCHFLHKHRSEFLQSDQHAIAWKALWINFTAKANRETWLWIESTMLQLPKRTLAVCVWLYGLFYGVAIMGTSFKICKMSRCYLKRNEEWAWRNIYHFLRWCSATGSELCFSFLMQDSDAVTVLKEHRSCIKLNLQLHSGSLVFLNLKFCKHPWLALLIAAYAWFPWAQTSS